MAPCIGPVAVAWQPPCRQKPNSDPEESWSQEHEQEARQASHHNDVRGQTSWAHPLGHRRESCRLARLKVEAEAHVQEELLSAVGDWWQPAALILLERPARPREAQGWR